MHNPETALGVYAALAGISHRKQQLIGRDRFLILTGVAACRAGCLDAAEQCRELVLSHNPVHGLRQFPTFADAMRSPDFEPLIRSLERFCPVEKAEHLLEGQEQTVPQQRGDSAAEYARQVLQAITADSVPRA